VISGHVRVGAFCFIGVNATLRNSITLAPRTLVGAGAILMKDTAEGDVFVAERTPVFKKKSHQIDL
jgi:acetyltransferase-like isoleucine patch superfamily enzyme